MHIDNKRERAVHKFDIYMLTSTPFCSISTVEIPRLLSCTFVPYFLFVIHLLFSYLFRDSMCSEYLNEVDSKNYKFCTSISR